MTNGAIRGCYGLLSVLTLVVLLPAPAYGVAYRLSFDQIGDRLSWGQTLSGWQHTIPVGFSYSDSTAAIELSGSFHLSSVLNRGAWGENRWRDSSSAHWSLGYPILETTRLSLNASLSKSSDNFSRFREPILTQSVGVVLQHSPFRSGPFRSFSVTFSGGPSFDRRLGRRDRGIAYRTSLDVSPEFLDRVAGSFHFSKSDNTLKRRDLNETLRGHLEYGFAKSIHGNLSFSEHISRLNYLHPLRESGRDTTVYKQQTTRARSLAPSFTAEVGSNFTVAGRLLYSRSSYEDEASEDDPREDLSFRLRNPKRGTNRESTHLGWSGDVSFKPFDRSTFSYNLFYSTDEISYLANRAGFRRGDLDKGTNDLSMRSSFQFEMVENHHVTVSGLVRKISINQGVNDRDDFKSTLRASYQGTFEKSGLRLNARVSTDQNHRVYIKAERSANNAWNKNYLLNASTYYEVSERLFLSHRYDLFAYHRTYDYDNRIDPRSNIRRGWSMDHSGGSALSKRLKIRVGYRYGTDDYGSLVENAQRGGWEEIVMEDRNRRAAYMGVSYVPSQHFSMDVGYQRQSRREWDHRYPGEGVEVRDLADRTVLEVLSLDCGYDPGGKNTISISGDRTIRESLKYPAKRENRFNVLYTRRL